jgi:HK97 family phage major capsid protein
MIPNDMSETQGFETQAYETKALMAPGSDGQMAFDRVMTAFEAFKTENDTNEKSAHPDVLVSEKIDRISADLDRHMRAMNEHEVKMRRPRLDGSTRNMSEHRQAFEAYVRRGDASQIGRIEAKALSVGVSADGGYTAPPEVEAEIGRKLSIVSPMRSIASVRMVSSAVYRKPFATTGMAAGWVGETAARTQTNTPNLEAIDFPTMELYAMPAATQSLLDDSVVDLEQWVAGEVETTFAEQEGAAFVTGDGIAKPKGFMAVDTVAEASWVWNKLGFITTGNAAGFNPTAPADRIIDLIYTLKAGYRQNASFVMNRKVQAELRKIKGTDGHYLWQPPTQAGGRATLFNFPVVEAEEMPDLAANSFPIAFGDFCRGYLIVDRMGVRILRDPYSAKPYVLFYTTKRVGGGVQDFSAIKLLKVAV